MALFDKRKQEIDEKMVEGILNAQPSGMAVVRGEDCRLLFLNGPGRASFDNNSYSLRCKEAFASYFDNICDYCPNTPALAKKVPYTFDITDNLDRIFQVDCTSLTWLDERPAYALYFQEVTEQRLVQKRLYSLAYLDQLTNVPNRRRFKEDFEAFDEAIENGEISGVVAIFDLDNFKAINDTYGHNTGDVMLRRLVEYFNNEPDFASHIYRLGGDEFVLFYTDGENAFESDEKKREYYKELMKKGFKSFTMPNIDMSCTISMGLAFFPQQGTNSSELLRKADIALYMAKEEGRNQLKFFEDQYDSAKKFKDLYINIQPILDPAGNTFGYELTDRGNEGNDDKDTWNLSDFDRTMDALGLGEMENDAKYFIQYSNQLLSPAVLKNLPRDKFIIQIWAREDYSEEQLSTFRQLWDNGYTMALNGIKSAEIPPQLAELVTYCRVDPGALQREELQQLIAQNKDRRFIALGVEDTTAFSIARQSGFSLFQGFFFSQPMVKKTKDIDPMKVNYMRLLKLTSTEDYVNFAEISSIIASDVAMSYKLLQLLNSAAVGLRNTVSSIEMAVAYLGEEHLKKWIALLALRGIASDKPLELVRLSLIRAQMGELLAPYFKPPRNEKHLFLLGMFSLLHVALEKTKQEIFDNMPVAEDIRLSLLTDSGVYSDMLTFFSNYEYANWDEVTRFAEEHKLSDRIINNAYVTAVKWYNDLNDSTES